MSRWPCLCGRAAGRKPFGRGMIPAVLLAALAASMVCSSCSLDHPIRATREFALRAAAEGVSALEVRNRVGAIRVRGYDGPDVQVQVLVKVRASSDARAEALAKEVEVRSGREGDTLTLSSHLPDLKRRERIEVELDISVPWRQAGEDGPAAVPPPQPARALVCEMLVGLVRIRDMAAAVRVDLVTGSITVENVAGPVDVESKTGAIRVRRIAGAVTVTSSTGDIAVADVRGTVRANAAVGQIDIRNVQPPQGAEPSTPAVLAQASTGSICVEDVTGDVEATTSVGQVTVRRVRGVVTAHSTLGAVIQDQIEGPASGD